MQIKSENNQLLDEEKFVSAKNVQPKIVPAVQESHTVPRLFRRPSVLLSCCPQV